MRVLMILTDTQPTLEEAQRLVEGWVEMIHLPNGDQLLVNEEGRLKNMEINQPASIVAGQKIVGPALLLKGKARWT